jgi:endonuclease/exonuclease/phosphatase family metal-dependent hydrolase
MPTKIRLLSWNIESLGDAKATVPDPVNAGQVVESELINFINLVIRRANADVVGIMEVKSGRGASILGWLLPRLNNVAGAAYQWQGRVSARQDGGTQEEALYLWKQQANRLVLDQAGVPAPISSIGIVDRNVLETTFASLGIANNAVTQGAFLAALHTAGYILHGTFQGRGNSRPLTQTWRVDANAWNALASAPPPAEVNFGATPLPVPMTRQQRRALAAQLIGSDILRFVRYGDRSPFLGNFLVGNPPKRVMVGMLHAPGPQDLTRTDAINVIGLSTCAAAADNLVLMGDFNIAANQAGLTGVEYGRFDDHGTYKFAQLVPRQYQVVFDPIEHVPLGAGAQVLQPDQRTTVIDTYVDDTVPVATILANTFDKFFFRGNPAPAQQLTAADPRVWNIVRLLDPRNPDFNPQLARSALTFFRTLRGDAHLIKAASGLGKKYVKFQRTYNRADTRAKGLDAKIKATNPPPNHPLYTRHRQAVAEANKASQMMAAIGSQQIAIQDVRTVVNGHQPTPAGVGTGLAVYREAISDHFPISLDLTG